ncbi:multidrug effflux MFS transporter [Kiloniella laminariae]|uniref:Bcr/CflA family efflux transporter n=1 Tax=Kiloniella laminariae TaxID=454162 RepID=A0ABT4LF00_9PROT|nr:multidrug effflux MFS transporter [Kiloniella laminariae]MCZ4279688.1 multidrug effflux MFS transporter [Kiloniella laminariae]
MKSDHSLAEIPGSPAPINSSKPESFQPQPNHKHRKVLTPLGLPEFVILFALITSLTALSIDAMLPALPQIGRDLGVVDPRNNQLIITLFIFGMVFGDLLGGPISDAIGRKPAILLGIFIYLAGTVVAMTAQSFELLLLGRVIQGIGTGGPKIASRALVRDQYEGAAMARVMSLIMMIFILVPMVAPAFGQLVLAFGQWREIFLSFLLLASIAGGWLWLRQPETLPQQARLAFSPAKLVRSTGRIIQSRSIMAYSLAAGLMFGALLVYVSTSQAIFHDIYHTGDAFAFYFAILASSIAVSSLLNSAMVMRYGMHRLVVIALTGMTGFAGLLFAVAQPYEGIPPFAAFMVIGFLLFFCVGILFGNINAMAMQSLGKMAGLGASVIASISSLVAVVVSIGIGRLYDGTVMHIVIAMGGCGLLSLALVIIAKHSKTDTLQPA